MSRIFNCFGCGFYGEVNTSMYCQACAISQNQNRIDQENRRREERDRRYQELMERDGHGETYNGLFPNAGRRINHNHVQAAPKRVRSPRPEFTAEQKAERAANEKARKAERAIHQKVLEANREREQSAKNTKIALIWLIALSIVFAPVIYMFANWSNWGIFFGHVLWIPVAWGFVFVPAVKIAEGISNSY